MKNGPWNDIVHRALNISRQSAAGMWTVKVTTGGVKCCKCSIMALVGGRTHFCRFFGGFPEVRARRNHEVSSAQSVQEGVDDRD